MPDLKESVSNGKASVASAITDKGVETAEDATFDTMATNIRSIPSDERIDHCSSYWLNTYTIMAYFDRKINNYELMSLYLYGSFRPTSTYNTKYDILQNRAIAQVGYGSYTYPNAGTFGTTYIQWTDRCSFTYVREDNYYSNNYPIQVVYYCYNNEQSSENNSFRLSFESSCLYDYSISCKIFIYDTQTQKYV